MKRVIDWISAKVLDKILATITSGGGSVIAYSSPIIQHTGIPLAIFIGATFGLLLFDVIKRLFCEKKYTGETWFIWGIDGIFDGHCNIMTSLDVTSTNIIHIDNKLIVANLWWIIVEHHPIIIRKHNKKSPMVQETTNQSIIIPCSVQSSGEHYSILELKTSSVELRAGQKYKITF